MVKYKKKKDPFGDREARKYENPIPSREFILEYLAEIGQPATFEQMQADLDLYGESEAEALRRRLIAMVRDGQLLQNRKQAYGSLDKMELLAGRVIGHKDGFGFVQPDDGSEDLFLSPRQMRKVFHGDKVLTRVANIDTRGKREAIIVEVVERNTKQIVGRFYTESGANYVESSNQRITQEILIPPEDTKGAKHGQIVVVAITGQPAKFHKPIGEVVDVLGDHMAPGMEINVAIHNHDLPCEWPDAVEQEAASFPASVTHDAIDERKDLRDLAFVTIDGEDARDFDDAVYCEPRENDGWKLYVAIADVSHYVKPGSPLDKEAYKRGNSVYFPARVIPMLPEALSNNLCSLKPDVDRLVMCCEMIIQPTGRISKSTFYEATIKSHRRLTYTQVHKMMEKNDRRMRDQFKEVVPHLENLYDLFRILLKSRSKRGAIDFDMPETKIEFGSDRKIERIVPYERFDSHKVIEECMLCANISAAKFLEKHKQPGLYRVHEGPREEKLNDLQIFLAEMGLKMASHRDPVPGDYAAILRKVRERPDGHIIQTMLLRSMSQAVYSPDNRGHFGLSYDAYTHFTSPIRRYPDLLVHRAIKHIIDESKPEVPEDYFHQAGDHFSMTERRADDATNEVKDWLKCEFMMDKVGETYTGRISGVTNFGLFVELDEVFVEGLAHISTLPDDYYQFDAVRRELYGEHSGMCFRIGDTVTIKVARVDLDQCEIDFQLMGVPGAKKGRKGKSSKSRSKTKSKRDERGKPRKRKKKSRR